MQEQYKALAKNYHQRPAIYNKVFEPLVEFIRQNPAAPRIQVLVHLEKLRGEPANNADFRLLSEAIAVYNFLYAGVEEEMSDVSMSHLEEGDESTLTWHSIDHQRLLVLSDIHFPYHDRDALMIALKEGKRREVDSILLNGDILDFYQLSKFTKDFRKKSVRAEIDTFRYFIDQLKQRFPETTIYFKFGNHEQRLERWIMNNAQMFDGLFNIENIIQFNDHGIIYLKDNIGVKFGDLNIIHGHEIRTGIGVINVARTYYLKAQANILLGHWHQNQEYITRDIAGNIKGAWAQGCLCRLDAEYTFGLNQWNHGFSIVDKISPKGDFKLKLYRIVDGQFM